MNDDVKKLKKRLRAVIFLTVLIFCAAGGSVYAWFTLSGMASTNVTPMGGSISNGDASLLISASRLGPFDKNCELVLDGNPDTLKPLSTADLDHFYRAIAQNKDGIAVLYEAADSQVDEDALHGTVYLKCENAPCDVYFDAENLNVGSDAQSLAAMRLGIRITSDSGTNTYLFLLDELGAVAGAQSRATIPASSAVVSSISSGGQAAYASDPSTSISQYMAYKNSSDKYDAGTSVLVSLETDEVASVEYWLYLEGCDEQCFNPVQNKDAGLMLAFVGVDESQKGGGKMKQAFRNCFLCVTAIAALLSLTAATYAWFTSNQEVSTTRASARTAEESLELQISSDGSTFSNASPVAIAQVNQTSLTNLLPVSTADLTNFIYAPSTVSDMAVTFEPVTDEQYYYHGRIYLRALAQGLSSDTTLSLYLDQTDGLLGKDVNGTLLNACQTWTCF